MTLSECFEKYSDNASLKRPHHIGFYNIAWLKRMKGWANQESRDLGFIIPQAMIDDAIADDWKKVDDNGCEGVSC